jgi:hypothetical protein
MILISLPKFGYGPQKYKTAEDEMDRSCSVHGRNA